MIKTYPSRQQNCVNNFIMLLTCKSRELQSWVVEMSTNDFASGVLINVGFCKPSIKGPNLWSTCKQRCHLVDRFRMTLIGNQFVCLFGFGFLTYDRCTNLWWRWWCFGVFFFSEVELQIPIWNYFLFQNIGYGSLNTRALYLEKVV